MQVGKRVEGRDYYSPESEYKNRPDCIYEWNGNDYIWKEGAKYHSPQKLEHDLGKLPEYDRAVCLVSENFVHFDESNGLDIDPIRDITIDLL